MWWIDCQCKRFVSNVKNIKLDYKVNIARSGDGKVVEKVGEMMLLVNEDQIKAYNKGIEDLEG